VLQSEEDTEDRSIVTEKRRPMSQEHNCKQLEGIFALGLLIYYNASNILMDISHVRSCHISAIDLTYSSYNRLGRAFRPLHLGHYEGMTMIGIMLQEHCQYKGANTQIINRFILSKTKDHLTISELNYQVGQSVKILHPC
jgi:hypothetical protein